jgi:hypothetical protein
VKKTGKETGNGMKAVFLAAAVLATAGVVFYFGTAVHAAKASGPASAERRSAERRSADTKALVSQALSLPMFFEPNQGQTAPQVKFLARGAGYGLFLTADEAVLELQHPAASSQFSVVSSQSSVPSSQRASSSVIRMRLDGANASSRVSGASPLPGKSTYFIGNDSSKWHHDIPQFARVQYQAVYPGVDLIYYGNQGQLEYDFRVAPGAEPNQIALSFQGASARIDAGNLILTTANGDVRFNAPTIYQQDGNNRQPIAGSFRQLAGNKIGFTIGAYDHSRELVIDPVLTYSTYLGGGGESLVKVAINTADWIYVAGSTTSADFPFPSSSSAPPPYQRCLGEAPGVQPPCSASTAQNIFIAVINTSLQPPTYLPAQQLVYATYLGGSQVDSLAGIAVDTSSNIYVAGTTTSPNFPTTSNAFQTANTVATNNGFPGTHGFLSAITLNAVNNTYTLTYSTYLAGNGADTVTGMAIDNSCSTQQSSEASCNAYVTGVTTSTNGTGNGFPANANGYQTQSNSIQSNSAGNLQFFASKIYPANSGSQSMLYSTYFGGGYFGTTDLATGGGIAVDPSATTVNMYITGATNMLPVQGPNGEAPFPILNALQSCLNQSGQTTNCSNTPATTTDAFVAKINPNVVSTASLVYSTYLGGSDNDAGTGIAVDTTSNAYVTGSTFSDDWDCLGCGLTGFQTAYGGNGDAFIAKIGNQTGTGGVYPMTYFTYLGGSGPDIGQDIKVDSVGAAHVAGSTSSSDFPVTNDALQAYGGSGDAFVALISTTLSGTFPVTTPPGDYSTYLGGSGLDQGTGIAIDNTFGAAYVAGTTQSTNFPFPKPGGLTPFQGTLAGTQDAFVSQIGATSSLAISFPNTSPSPNPVAAGTQVAFTFDITNNGTDNANFVTFNATGLPTTGLAKTISATVTSGGGAASCNSPQGSTLSCYIPTLAVNAIATVEVDVTPSSPVLTTPISIAGNASANGGPVGTSVAQPAANVVDFTMAGVPTTQTINAGDTATFQIVFSPTSSLGYNATITPSQTTSPSMVTATAPSFNPSTVTLSGSGSASTTLSIATVARPVNTGSLLRRGSFYAAWLPIGGLSLVGLGIGAGRKRRRWLAGAVLGLIAGIILLQPGCGSASTSTATPGGTLAGRYIITITGSAGTEATHTQQVYLIVD